MAWVAAAAAIAGVVMQYAGQKKQEKAAERQGAMFNASKQFEADQLEQNAGQEQAAAQRRAIEQRRRASLVASRAMAVSAASGAGASDPTVENIISDLAGEGAFRASQELYEGEDRARRMRLGADASRFEGATGQMAAGDRASAMRTSSYGTLLSGAGSLYGKYGMGGPKGNPNAGAFDSYELHSGAGMTDPRYG
jgi:hypothetical protein